MAILERIHSPADLKQLPLEELLSLAGEIRTRIFDAVRNNGGHLASNLGVVELTLALHRVFEFGPYPDGPDRLLFDVGHQAYTHKMVTGRTGQFDRLRKKGRSAVSPRRMNRLTTCLRWGMRERRSRRPSAWRERMRRRIMPDMSWLWSATPA